MSSKPVTGRFHRDLLTFELASRGWNLEDLAERSRIHVETAQRAYRGESVRAATIRKIQNALRDNPPSMTNLLEVG